MSSQQPDDRRPALGPSDAVLSAGAPLSIPGPGEQWGRPDDGRPQISGAADAVIGAPLSAPPDGARDGLQLGVDAAGGFLVPKQLDGAGRRPSKRP